MTPHNFFSRVSVVLLFISIVLVFIITFQSHCRINSVICNRLIHIIYLQVFIVLNIFSLALILVYLSTYVERLVPERACGYGKNLLSKHLHKLFGQTFRKYLVYLCDNGPCGEWTDRLQGIVMSYFLAKLTKRKFAIMSTSPIKLDKLMEPVLVNWTFDRSNVIHGSCAVYDFLSNPSELLQKLESVDLDQEFPEDVVYFRLSKFSWSRLHTNRKYRERVDHIGNGTAKAFYQLIHDILRLNKRMLYQFIVYKNQFKPKAVDRLVCAVVEGIEGPLGEANTKALWGFLDQYKHEARTKVVVSSTDNKLLDLAIVRYTDHFMSMPGVLSKFDTGEELRYRILDNLRQIILDFYTLVECNTLVLTCGSDLGKLSAITRYAHADVHYLHSGKVWPTTVETLGRDFETGKCTVI
ncbi:uncharacterized protein LOC135479325 [Liolophura sinensis]|uniref:uncharacterized protein LOC135479325 n=1 Tax=Liolophura sinensis TaxID=3198878 RepID=UPI0031596110